MQKGKPVAYASRAMTSVEQNYAQIEKEMLAICFATRKFHQYVYGKPNVSVQTDHNPPREHFEETAMQSTSKTTTATVFGLGVFGMARRHALVSLRHAALSQRHAAPSSFLYFLLLLLLLFLGLLLLF